MQVSDSTTRKLRKLENAVTILKRIRQFGWLDDLSQNTFDRVQKQPSAIDQVIRYARNHGESVTTTLLVNSEQSKTRLVLKSVFTDRVNSMLFDTGVVVSVGLDLKRVSEITREESNVAEDQPNTARKLSQLKRAVQAVERIKEAGWLDDVSDETREMLRRLPVNVANMMKMIDGQGESFLATVGVGAELIGAELIIRRAVEERVRSIIDDPEVFVSVGLSFLSEEELKGGSGDKTKS